MRRATCTPRPRPRCWSSNDHRQRDPRARDGTTTSPDAAMTPHDPIVIVSAVRTPLGRFLGDLSPVTAPSLGAHVIRAALERGGLAPDSVDEVLMGCVLPAGQGQAPARQAMSAAGLPDAVGATTVNKVCGSGMKATMLAHDLLLAGSAEILIA